MTSDRIAHIELDEAPILWRRRKWSRNGRSPCAIRIGQPLPAAASGRARAPGAVVAGPGRGEGRLTMRCVMERGPMLAPSGSGLARFRVWCGNISQSVIRPQGLRKASHGKRDHRHGAPGDPRSRHRQLLEALEDKANRFRDRAAALTLVCVLHQRLRDRGHSIDGRNAPFRGAGPPCAGHSPGPERGRLAVVEVQSLDPAAG